MRYDLRVIDTHCHMTYPGIAERVEQAVHDAQQLGVDRMVSVCTVPEDGWQTVELAKQFPGVVFATAGLHPHHADASIDPHRLKDQLRQIVMDAADHPGAGRSCVIALGEMGLDRHYPDPPIEHQRRAFIAQLELAMEPAMSHLPIIIHNRKATDETLAILRDGGFRGSGERFVFHCFTGSVAEVEAVLAFGAYVGFTGIVTFKNAREVAEASDRVPMDRLLIETDAPYLTPEPHRKVKVNEPKFLPHVAAYLADRRGMAHRDFIAQVDRNAERFYGLATMEASG